MVQLSGDPTVAGEVQGIVVVVSARKLAVSAPAPFTVTVVDAVVGLATVRQDEPETQVKLQLLKVYPLSALAEIEFPADPALYQVLALGVVVPAPEGETANVISYCVMYELVIVTGADGPVSGDDPPLELTKTYLTPVVELETGEVKLKVVPSGTGGSQTQTCTGKLP